ncbi:hypothetical protein LGW72_10060 [Streptococcus mutans]|nr:hypothetical protein [Streptococcus mutans]MCB5028129.1 hypothetical protein [Streptococcus mutans]MCB5030029.1 hypothetical protein [Streptococcus mutans]
MKLMLAVLIIGSAVGMSYSDSRGHDRVANALLVTLLAFIAAFAVFGFIGQLGSTYITGETVVID